jgi:hypothetical protein
MYALSGPVRFQLRLPEIKYFESALALDIPSAKLFFHYFFFLSNVSLVERASPRCCTERSTFP